MWRFVGNGQVHDPADSKHPAEAGQRSQRVLAVLEEVIRDHEVERPVGNRLEALAVVDHLDLDERQVVQLGIVLAQLLDVHAVDELDERSGRELERRIWSEGAPGLGVAARLTTLRA